MFSKKYLGSANTILLVLLVIAAFLVGSLWTRIQYLEKGGGTPNQNEKNNSPTNVPQQPTLRPGPATETLQVKNVTTFLQKKDAKICKEDGKPIIYFFSTTWCPHCQWIKETFDKVASEYVKLGKIKAYHWEIDINDDTLTEIKEKETPKEARAVYEEFNPGGSIPTFVFGCKYFRIGNGFEREQNLEAEEKEFRALIEDLI